MSISNAILANSLWLENHIAPDNRFLKSTRVYYAILLKIHETNLNNTKQNTYIHTYTFSVAIWRPLKYSTVCYFHTILSVQIIKQRTLLSLLLEINTTTIQPIYRASCLLLALSWDDRWSVVSFPFRVWGNPARLVAWRHGERLSLVGWLLCAVMTLEVLPWVPFCFRCWSSFGSELGDMCESSSQMVYGWGALRSAIREPKVKVC